LGAEVNTIFVVIFLCARLGDNYLAAVAQFTQSEAKGTLVLQQSYSSIVAVACPERSEGFCNSIQLLLPHSLIFLLKESTAIQHNNKQFVLPLQH